MRCLSIVALGFAVAAAVSPVALAKGKGGTVIDKSCIYMCDSWGEHGCLKWTMRCKGDPGHPKGLTLKQ